MRFPAAAPSLGRCGFVHLLIAASVALIRLRQAMSAPQPGLVSVVIPTIGRGAPIIDTVESVLRNGYPAYEVIIGDQSEGDRTREALAPHIADGRIRYFQHARRGVALNRNLGAWKAHGEFVAFVDDDCTVPADWIESFVRAFRSNGRIGMVFGNVLAGPHDSKLGFVQAYVRKDSFLATKASQKHLVEGIGGCMAVRKNVWKALGGFDLALGAGADFRSAEDTDLSLRVLLAGHYVFETPEISVIHHGFRTWSQRPGMMRDYLCGLGAMTGKHLRLGNWQVLHLAAAYAFRWSFTGPVVDLGPRPPRLVRLKAYLGGVMRGALARSDRSKAVFRTFYEYLKQTSPD